MKLKLEEIGEVELIDYVDLNTSDQVFVLKMRNHHSVRRWMYSKEEISFDEHKSFLSSLEKSTDLRYFMVKSRGEIVGSISFSDIGTGSAVRFGIFTNPFAEMRGAGKILERAGSFYAHWKVRAKTVKLEVFAANSRAVSFYKKRGFEAYGSERIKEQEVLMMRKELGSGDQNE